MIPAGRWQAGAGPTAGTGPAAGRNRWSWRERVGSWRVALRIAAREARRAPRRTVLVVAMIALPVFGLAFAAVSYDTFRLTTAETLERRLGTADALLYWQHDGPIEQNPDGNSWQSAERERSRSHDTSEVARLLPAGSRLTRLVDVPPLLVGVAGRPVTVRARGVQVDDPLVRGLVDLHEGRAPHGPHEIAANRAALDLLRTRLGGTVPAAGGTPTWTVVGVVEFPSDLKPMVAVPPDAPLPGPADSWLVDVPGALDWSRVEQLNRQGVLVVSRQVRLDPPSDTGWQNPDRVGLDTHTLGLGGFAGALGLLEVVLLAGPAFAVSARRRRRDLALTAAAGGAPAHLRRIVLADGVVLGLAGAVGGLVTGTAVAFLARPLVEQYVVHERAGAFRLNPPALLGIAALAVLAGVLAALVPALTVARQDVVVGLVGHQPRGRGHWWWLAAGVVATALGMAVTALGVGRQHDLLTLAGLTVGEIGLVCATPALVVMLGWLGGLLPLAPRIALRDSSRNRAAAVPAIAAVMAAVAGSVAISTYLANEQGRYAANYRPSLPVGYLTVDTSGAGPVRVDPLQVSAAAGRAGIRVTGYAEIAEPTCPPGSPAGQECWLNLVRVAEWECPYLPGQPLTDAQNRAALRDPRCRLDDSLYYNEYINSVVDDGNALALLTGADPADLARARTVLAAGGVVVTDRRYVSDGQVTVQVSRVDSANLSADRETPPTEVRLPGYVLTSGIAVPLQVYSPGAVSRLGLSGVPRRTVLATGAAPTEEQLSRLATDLTRFGGLQVTVERGNLPSPVEWVPVLLAAAAGFVALAAAGLATALAAAEGRADLTTLAAVGASPRLRRVLAASRAGVISGTGTGLGVVVGLGAATAVLAGLNQRYGSTWPAQTPYPLLVPWRALGVLLVVPVLAMTGAALFTRSRLPVEQRND